MIQSTPTQSLTICGECIKNTALNDAASTEEAMCVSPRGDQTLQLARQLTAAALNCVISGSGSDCSGQPQIAATFQDCNTHACLGIAGTLSVGECIGALDCFNNGGSFDQSTGSCATGTCGGDGLTPCNGSTDCGTGISCVPLPNNCHDQPLCNQDINLCFEPPGPAGSANECNAARDNACTITGPGEAQCGSDSCP